MSLVIPVTGKSRLYRPHNTFDIGKKRETDEKNMEKLQIWSFLESRTLAQKFVARMLALRH
jgi:hypothetical protein